MKLSTIRITEFQCIRDTNPVQITNITCLVGKNESGKTALLDALYRLNPLIPEYSKYDVTDDYPRADVEDYNQSLEAGNAKPAIVATATFTLSEEEITPIEAELGKGVLKKPRLTLSKGYDNKLLIHLENHEPTAAKAIISEAQIPSEIAKSMSSEPNLSALAAALQQRTDPSEQEHLGRLKSIIERIRVRRSIMWI